MESTQDDEHELYRQIGAGKYNSYITMDIRC